VVDLPSKGQQSAGIGFQIRLVQITLVGLGDELRQSRFRTLPFGDFDATPGVVVPAVVSFTLKA
jgi:hypothetical protein